MCTNSTKPIYSKAPGSFVFRQHRRPTHCFLIFPTTMWEFQEEGKVRTQFWLSTLEIDEDWTMPKCSGTSLLVPFVSSWQQGKRKTFTSIHFIFEVDDDRRLMMMLMMVLMLRRKRVSSDRFFQSRQIPTHQNHPMHIMPPEVVSKS